MKIKITNMLVAVLIIALVGCGSSIEDVNDQDVIVTQTDLLDTSDMFSEKDLEQEIDVSEATTINLEDDKTITIEKEGVYLITGTSTNTMLLVDAEDAKVQLVLEDIHITNEVLPGVYVKSADKVFITTTNSNNSIEVTGEYKSDGDVNLDAAIYSKSDLVLNGLGILEIISVQGNGISSKDDLKVTGGDYNIESLKDGLEANDSICIYDGNITIVSQKDGFHSENDNDDLLGFIYIREGTITITAEDDGIHGTSVVQIDGGTINIPSSSEGIEGTYILINNGIINIYALDDGINATSLSASYDPVIEVNGGMITMTMASGDTDGFDANGDIYINGGTIDVTATSSFDADGEAILNGGTVTVNGTVVTELPESQMGGKGNKGH